MKKVLVLEDEANIRSFVVINLKRAGYEAIEAETGEEALAQLKRNPDIKVALLDIMLPQLSGMEVLRRLGRDIPVLDKSLCHIIASGMFNGIFEIVVHDMPRDQAMRDVDQLRDFYTAGWLKLMGG